MKSDAVTACQSRTMPDSPRTTHTMLYLMVFSSGFAGLTYQILWMRQLGLLFGNTSHAAAVTLGAFFLGLALGSWFWGKRTGVVANSLRLYAGLQAGIAVTALAYFAILSIFYAVYPRLFQATGGGALLLLVKFALALLLIFPPAFCMGGTIPAVGHFMIRRKSTFGTISAMLYGVNTLGAALGALCTAFFFVMLFGFRLTCIGAIVVSATIAFLAWRLSRRVTPPARLPVEAPPPATEQPRGEDKSRWNRWTILGLAFLSGFGVLALEVLWTRMFAQVHENSVYSFATVLVIVLVSLAFGAMLSSLLARLALPPMRVLTVLALLSGLAVALCPILFMRATDNLEMIPTADSLSSYILTLFQMGFVSIGIVALVLGTIFPFLMKAEERYAIVPGLSLGRLAAFDTAGAILGSLLCGFLFLEVLGLWRTMQLIAAGYLLVGIAIGIRLNAVDLSLKLAGVILLALIFTVLSPVGLPVTSLQPSETLVAVWEASGSTVAVVDSPPQQRTLKLNSHYRLGSTWGLLHQILQSRIPLMAFPQTRSVFFLGLGTGNTAGAALDPQHRVERIVACELVKEVVIAAREYMTSYRGHDFTLGLFEDPRVEILIEDGRHYLMASGESFDMINADLFLPYRSGAGSLYSREHFVRAKQSLNPGGVFVQWLPLYQLTENEVGIIARTMLDVFPQVTLWRNNFQPGVEIVAFVGHADHTPLPASNIDARAGKAAAVDGKSVMDLQNLDLPLNEQTVLLYYGGNMTESRGLFNQYPMNTDDKPRIEYATPRNLRQKEGGVPTVFTGPRIAGLIETLLSRTPPAKDPMLVNRTEENRRLPLAGAALHRAHIGFAMRDEDFSRRSWNAFVREWLHTPRQ